MREDDLKPKIEKPDSIPKRFWDAWQREWQGMMTSDEGFFCAARHRRFDKAGGERVIDLLSQIEKIVDRNNYQDFVIMLYNVPLLLNAWENWCVEMGADYREYGEIESKIRQKIGDIIKKRI